MSESEKKAEYAYLSGLIMGWATLSSDPVGEEN